MRVGVKLLLVAVAVMAAGVVIGFYVSNLTTLAGSPTYSVPVHNVDGHKVVNLELQTVAAVGPKLSPNPDWVSYLIKDQSGQWKRETVWDLPAHATVHVTIYNFDGASGLRNPYLARPQGMVGNRGRREEPVRLRAVRDVERASHHQVHVPHHHARPLPLAMLRALRGRLGLRLRRADADDRLHGRLSQREGLNGRPAERS
jgi:hypothetical protein